MPKAPSAPTFALAFELDDEHTLDRAYKYDPLLGFVFATSRSGCLPNGSRKNWGLVNLLQPSTTADDETVGTPWQITIAPFCLAKTSKSPYGDLATFFA